MVLPKVTMSSVFSSSEHKPLLVSYFVQSRFGIHLAPSTIFLNVNFSDTHVPILTKFMGILAGCHHVILRMVECLTGDRGVAGFEPHWCHSIVVLEQDTFILA